MNTPMRKTSPGRWVLMIAVLNTALCALNIYRSIGATRDVFTQLAVLTGVGAVVSWVSYLRQRGKARA